MQWYAANFYAYTTNTDFRDQCVKMLNARAAFAARAWNERRF